MHALTRKDALFHWSEDCQAAFDQLKTRLTTSPITAFPDFSQEFRLYTDASTAGLGAILAQVREGKERIICCASRALNKAKKSYPATKLECLAIVWAVAKFRPYLMAMPFEVFTDHYALQWLKTMHTGSALLHRWSAALEEYDFTVRHRPGKIQTHVDGLSHLPVGPAPPEDAVLHLQVDTKEEARRLAQELHTATHLGGQALWKLFSDRYSHKAGRRICIEVAQSCPQCQRGSDYGHRQKTTGTIESKGPWDTLSVDIVGPLPADRRHEFIIVFVDCFSRFTILVPASNHTADTVSEALLRHVVPYFGTPRRLLSDRGREFVGEVWGKLTSSLGIQRILTSPYHPEGNSINERSHRTMNNMLRARLLRDLPSRKWVVEIPGIMLALNAMVHEPHGFSASMIATGREPSLPPDLEGDACASPSSEDPVTYVDMVRQRLTLTHQQMTPPPAPVAVNPYHEDDLIFVMTTPPERTSKLAPRWKGPFVVKRVPNAYQVTYEDDMVWMTVHVNHMKPAKTPAGGFPVPVSPPAPPSPPPMYLSRNLQWKQPAKPPQPAAPTEGSPQPAAPVAEPTQPAAAPSAASPPPSRPTTRSSANGNSASRSEPRSPATPGRTNENSWLGQPLRRSARLNPTAMCLNSQPQAAPAHSSPTSTMARTYPYLLPYRTCLGRLEDPCTFSSIYIEDLHSGQKTYVKHIQQLINVLPKTVDPNSRFTLRAQVTPLGHQRMRDSLRTALWWLLPKGGDFRRAADGIHYYLARQGRRVILRGGNVTSPLHESRLLWIHDQHLNQPPRVTPRQTDSKENHAPVPRNNHPTVPRSNIQTVPRSNNAVNNSDARAKAPHDMIRSASWFNSNLLPSSVPVRSSVCNPVPRTNLQHNNATTQVPNLENSSSLPPKRKRDRKHRREWRVRERENKHETVIHDARWDNESSLVPASSSVPVRVTQSDPQDSDPISSMRTAVYPPLESVGNSAANGNSPFQIGRESREFPGLYKPTAPAPEQDTWAFSSAANSSEIGPPSPTRTSAANSSDSRTRTGIVYPLQPRSRRPDVCIEVEASLPEPAALLRPDLRQPEGHAQPQEAHAHLLRTFRRLSRKRRRNHSTAVFRPAKRSPPRGHWCDIV